MYSVRGEIDQISTNTSRYSTCCAANVYIFVYIFIGAHLVPLRAIRSSQVPADSVKLKLPARRIFICIIMKSKSKIWKLSEMLIIVLKMFCQFEDRLCDLNDPCDNGGTCDTATQTCRCTAGWRGVICDLGTCVCVCVCVKGVGGIGEGV